MHNSFTQVPLAVAPECIYKAAAAMLSEGGRMGSTKNSSNVSSISSNIRRQVSRIARKVT